MTSRGIDLTSATDGRRSPRSIEHSGISAVGRAMHIFEALSRLPQGMTVTQLGDELRINKGLVHRILASLMASGYVYKDDLTQHYRLTTKLLGMAFQHVGLMDAFDVLLPILRRLASETQELAELNCEQNGRLVLVAKAESPRRVKVIDHVGEELKLHATAGGKAWLAHLSDDRALQLLVEQGLPRLSEHTITNVVDLQAELRRIREHGGGCGDR